MRTLTPRLLTLPLLGAFAFLGALAVLAMVVIPAGAQSPAGSIELVAVDTDVAGNTPTTVGDVQVCSELGVGETRDVDIVVKGIPPVSEGVGGLAGFEFTMLYDERYLKVTAYDVAGQLIGSDAGSNIVDFSEVVPSEDGTMGVAAADFGTGTEESGDGVLARLTVEGVSAGTSDFVYMGFAIIADLGNNEYEFDALNGGLIAVGVTCDPNATPPPSPLPTGGPPTGIPPEESPGPTDGGEESPGSTDGPTGTGGPDDSPTRTGGATGSPGNGATGNDDDDDGGSSALIAIIAVIAALVVLGGGGAYFFMRRRETPAP